MNNTQFHIALALPFVTILIVWIGTTVANRAAIADLRADMNNANQNLRADHQNLRTELRSIIDDLRAEITRRFDAFEAKLDRLDTEVRKDHEHRISVLEDRVFA